MKNRPRIFSRINECWQMLFEYSWFHSWMVVCFAGVVARVLCRVHRDIESLRGRMGESTRQVKGLFESVLSESFEFRV